MKLDEYIVLEALNIASTIHRQDRTYQATAAQVAHVLQTDRRFERERRALGDTLIPNARWVGARLRALHLGRPVRRAQLVSRVTTRAWTLTTAALEVLTA